MAVEGRIGPETLGALILGVAVALGPALPAVAAADSFDDPVARTGSSETGIEQRTASGVSPASHDQTVYLGSDTTIPVEAESWEPDGGGSGSGDSYYWRWAWALDWDDGKPVLQTYARAKAGSGSSAQADAILRTIDSFGVERRCDGQQDELPARVRLDTTLEGSVWDNPGTSSSHVLALFGLDGSEERIIRESDDTHINRDLSATIDRDLTVGTHQMYAELRSHAEAQDSHAESDHHGDFGISSTDGDDWLKLHRLQFQWLDRNDPRLTDHEIQAADEAEGWYKPPVEVQVRYRDPESCVDTIRHRVEDGSQGTHDIGPNEDPVTVSVPSSTGNYRVDFQAIDYAKNAESDSAHIPVDASPPSTNSEVRCERNDEGDCVEKAEVLFHCRDGETSCNDGEVRYRVDDGPWRQGDSVTIRSYGEHEVEYYGTDSLGHEEKPNSRTVFVDCGGPTGPLERAIGQCTQA